VPDLSDVVGADGVYDDDVPEFESGEDDWLVDAGLPDELPPKLLFDGELPEGVVED
jgi:hypothetical protein